MRQMSDPGQNPFAPPEAALEAAPAPAGAPTPGLWREGRLVVAKLELVPDESVTDGLRPVAPPFPERCVRCNRPTTYVLRRDLYWHHPGLYVLFFLGIVLYALAATFMRRHVVLHVGLCSDHRAARLASIGITWALVCGGLGLCAVVWPATEVDAVAAIGLTMFSAGVFYGFFAGRVLRARWIDDEYVWIAGAGAAFRDSLPERKE
jgi:hypothetical protein